MSGIDPLAIVVWALRLAFLAAILGVLLILARSLRADLARARDAAPGPVGCLVVRAAPGPRPRPGAVHPIGAVATLGGDPGSTVVIDDPVVADEALVLAFRGSHWVILGSAAGRGVRVNGTPAADGTLLGFGDELAIGAVVLRLDHPGPG